MNFKNIIRAFPKVCEFYWNTHYLPGRILYKMETGSDPADVRLILSSTSPEIISVGKKCKTPLDCLRWVVSNVSYLSDRTKWNKPEKWQEAPETFALRTGDCEDMSILLMKVMEASGIPEWRRKIVCGEAKEPVTGNMVGHAYVIYLTDEFVWTPLDPAYLPIDSITNFGKAQKKNENYGKIWFTFNEKNSWHQHSTDIIL